MADRSAGVLAGAILAEVGPRSIESLAEQMAVDPPLVLWAVCRASLDDAPRPRSVRDAARWLLQQSVEVLQWGEGHAGQNGPLAERPAEPFADRVAGCLETAELAALLAADGGQEAAEEAHLLGLLHQAHQWPSLEADDPPESLADLLPDWLIHAEGNRAANCAARAAAALAGGDLPDGIEFDPDACRRRAADGRQRWIEVHPLAASPLPPLVARLARLRQLESRFHQTLETEKLEALAEFAAGAGHEINNPLAIIGGRAQLLLRDETDPERRRELAVMNAQVKRAHEMIADIRLFSRPPDPEPTTLDLAGLIDTVIEEMAPQTGERAITLTRTSEPGPWEIEADPVQLNVALHAVCRNALEAIGRDGRIEIAVSGSASRVEIRVTDDGPGILPEQRRHLFDPFYSARQAGRGLGFGLSKAWRIVTNHGGKIEVESEPGKGATFTISLPRRLAKGDRRAY
jgi:hypothetical protein